MNYSIYKTHFDSLNDIAPIKLTLDEEYGEGNYGYGELISLFMALVYSDRFKGTEYTTMSFEEALLFLDLMCEENNWLENASPTVFLETTNLLEKIDSEPLSINELTTLDFAYKTFCVSFPEGGVFAGKAVKSLLVSVMPAKELDEIWWSELGDIEPNETCISVVIDYLEEESGRAFTTLSEVNSTNHDDAASEAVMQFVVRFFLYVARNPEALQKDYKAVSTSESNDEAIVNVLREVDSTGHFHELPFDTQIIAKTEPPCWRCGSEIYDIDDLRVECDGVSATATCERCYAEWELHYAIEGIYIPRQ